MKIQQIGEDWDWEKISDKFISDGGVSAPHLEVKVDSGGQETEQNGV